jgi:hypothetical protein
MLIAKDVHRKGLFLCAREQLEQDEEFAVMDANFSDASRYPVLLLRAPESVNQFRVDRMKPS